MRIAVAFDHRGVKLRERVLEEILRFARGYLSSTSRPPDPRTWTEP